MKFCRICDNLLYMNIAPRMENVLPQDKEEIESGKYLYFTCKNCNYYEKKTKHPGSSSVPVLAHHYIGNENEKEEADDDHCIMKVNFFDDVRTFQKYQTPFIKYDMTLPRVNNIECPRGCQKQEGKTPEVIVIKYDQNALKFLYFCCHCEHFWKIENA